MTRRPSGHVYRYDGRRGAVWRPLFRLHDGRRVHKTLGPAWTRRGRPHAGYLTKRMAQDWLDDGLGEAPAGAPPGNARTGGAVAQAWRDYPPHQESRRRPKPTTLRDHNSIMKAHL